MFCLRFTVRKPIVLNEVHFVIDFLNSVVSRKFEPALHIWTATSKNVALDMCTQWRFRSDCAYSRSLIKILIGRILNSQGCKVYSCGQRRLRSDFANAQTDLRLSRAHMSAGTFFPSLYGLYHLSAQSRKLANADSGKRLLSRIGALKARIRLHGCTILLWSS